MTFDDGLPSLYLSWPVRILFGFHGNIKFKKKKKKKKDFFIDQSSKTTEVVGL